MRAGRAGRPGPAERSKGAADDASPRDGTPVREDCRGTLDSDRAAQRADAVLARWVREWDSRYSEWLRERYWQWPNS